MRVDIIDLLILISCSANKYNIFASINITICKLN